MNKKKVIETLFDKKVIKILRLFINNPDHEYYLREIARSVKVSPASTYRIITNMKDLNILDEKKVKHLITYKLNREGSKIFSNLLEDKVSALDEFIEFISDIPEVDEAILHGKEEKDKASVLVVGNEVDKEFIGRKVAELKEKFGFNIILLVLDPVQYSQMLSMGLYPGKKQILFTR